MSKLFFVTYDVVTPESAEEGDVAETGFVAVGGWRHELATAAPGEIESLGMGLREAIDMIGTGLNDGGDGRSFYAEPRIGHLTGNSVSYAFHIPESVTPSSAARIARLLA